MDKTAVGKRLNELHISSAVLERYEEPHRFYHTLQHIDFLLKELKQKNYLEDKVLFLSALFHDAVYNPKSAGNEEDSATYFLKESAGSLLSEEEKMEVCNIIRDTRNHQPSSEKSAVFQQSDLAIFDQSFPVLLEYEHQVFKEYQFVDYSVYKQKRIEVLNGFNHKGKLDRLIEYVHFRKPLIGVFAGSFNPFHRGHYNVLQKAERSFDKVIIAFGKNPEKNQRTWVTPQTIQFRQIEEYEGLLTDFIDSLSYEVTVIRGLRNSTDFQYEQNQYRYIQELKPDINIVNIFCDKEFEHISSSGIRTLEKYNKHLSYLLD